jgi:hypothetical protein
MGYKSRSNFLIPLCIKRFNCNNYKKECEFCLKFNQYKEKENDTLSKTENRR